MECIVASRRHSSSLIYAAKWKVFYVWCQENSVDYSRPTIPDIAEFLVYLFDTKGLQPITIKGYHSMLSDTFSHEGRIDIGNNQTLSKMIKHFCLKRPRSLKLTPKWNLAWVLLKVEAQELCAIA